MENLNIKHRSNREQDISTNENEIDKVLAKFII
jgi:hypothetical protein